MNYYLLNWLRFACVALLSLSLSLAGCGVFDDETFEPPEGEGPWILVDLYHSRLQNHEDYRLGKWDYDYQGIYGYYRAFEHLTDHGYKTRSIREMPLSAARLDGFDVLFINLVDAGRPKFSDAEYEAIQQWVRDGGGLFVIADHTNVYRSSERLNPLLEPMGIEIGYHTAVDYPPEFSVNGTAWLMLWDFDRHYVTRGVDMISPQTGGPIFGDYGVAWTSSRSFADYWDEEETHGFYGNWTFDGDAELEPRGPLAMVAARDYGDGRVVVVGDQNIFGDAWLHFGNNFELMMNTFQWLAGLENAPPLRAARPAGFNIGLDMAHNDFSLGRGGEDDYYPFFVNFNRDHQVTARARLGIDTDDDALILMNPSVGFDAAAIRRIGTFFEQGKTVILSFQADRIEPATIDLLAELAPEFSLDIAGTHVAFAATDPATLQSLEIPRLEGAHALESDILDVEGLRLSAMPTHAESRAGDLSPYLLAITSSWGAPFVRARVEGSDGTPIGDSEFVDSEFIDIARRRTIGEGELIIFVQDAFFRNRTLGYSEVTAPTEQNRDAIEFQYRLIDYLKAGHR
jgi:hypothetical protein